MNSDHPWGHHWHERAGDSTRTVFRLLHQEIEVEFVRLAENSWRTSDSRGGMRHESFTETGLIERGCDDCLPDAAVAAYDASGRIVHVVTNDDGYPTETWYGETLVARYHYAQIDGARPEAPDGSLGDARWLPADDSDQADLEEVCRLMPSHFERWTSGRSSRILRGRCDGA